MEMKRKLNSNVKFATKDLKQLPSLVYRVKNVKDPIEGPCQRKASIRK